MTLLVAIKTSWTIYAHSPEIGWLHCAVKRRELPQVHIMFSVQVALIFCFIMPVKLPAALRQRCVVMVYNNTSDVDEQLDYQFVIGVPK